MSKNGDKLKISENGPRGVQVEWRGILLTLQLNEHHGLTGSIAEMDGKKVKLLNFHGASGDKPFPFAFHEETMDAEK